MKNLFLFSLLILLVSCKNQIINKQVETIKAESAGDQSLFFSEFVKEIEIIPLDNKDEAYLADAPELIVYNSEYYIYNRHFMGKNSSPSRNILLKFDSKGKLLGYIGDEGVGLGKYRYVANFCISEDTIYVFTSPDFVINKFKLTGEFIEKKTIPYKYFMQALKFGDEYLLYLNRNSGVRDERLVVMDEQGKESSAFLPTQIKVCPYFENNCLTVGPDNEVQIREFHNDTIYTYSSKKGVVPKLRIDFAEKFIPVKEYLKSKGSMENLSKMLENPYTCISKYFENKKYFFIEMLDNRAFNKYDYLYAIKDKSSGIIRWFNFEKENKFLNNSFHFFDSDKLYCLAFPTDFNSITDNVKKLIKNPEVLDKITPNDNRVLLIITMK